MPDITIPTAKDNENLGRFIGLCEARARLWQFGEYDMPAAVGALHRVATDWGLYRAFGVDRIQYFISAAFMEIRNDL